MITSESTVVKYILETFIDIDNGSQALIFRRTNEVDVPVDAGHSDATVTPRQKSAVEDPDIQLAGGSEVEPIVKAQVKKKKQRTPSP